MSKETDGPALPQSSFWTESETPCVSVDFGGMGMALRDNFAGQAMQGDWAAQDQGMGWFDNAVSEEILYERAKVYYRMAEAMLRARDE